MIEWGHGCAFCFGVNRLCSEIGQGHMPGSTDDWGCRLCFEAGQYHRLGIEAAQHHCSGPLFIWSQRLCSTVEWDWGFIPLSRKGYRMAFMAYMVCWLGIQIRQDCRPNSLVRWGHQLGSPDGQSSWLISVLVCYCKQEYDLPRSDC